MLQIHRWMFFVFFVVVIGASFAPEAPAQWYLVTSVLSPGQTGVQKNGDFLSGYGAAGSMLANGAVVDGAGGSMVKNMAGPSDTFGLGFGTDGYQGEFWRYFGQKRGEVEMTANLELNNIAEIRSGEGSVASKGRCEVTYSFGGPPVTVSVESAITISTSNITIGSITLPGLGSISIQTVVGTNTKVTDHKQSWKAEYRCGVGAFIYGRTTSGNIAVQAWQTPSTYGKSNVSAEVHGKTGLVFMLGELAECY